MHSISNNAQQLPEYRSLFKNNEGKGLTIVRTDTIGYPYADRNTTFKKPEKKQAPSPSESLGDWKLQHKAANRKETFTTWEAPLFLQEFGNYIQNKIKKSPHGFDRAIDLGAGSGFFTSLLAQKAIPVTGIDMHKNAINLARKNIETNLKEGQEVYWKLAHDYYLPTPKRREDTDLIILHPPSFPYPKLYAYKIPIYARSGSTGQQGFRTQLKYAASRLKHGKHAKIIFATLVAGDQSNPDLEALIPDTEKDNLLMKAELILKPMPRKEFVSGYIGDSVEINQIPGDVDSSISLVFGTISKVNRPSEAEVQYTPLVSQPRYDLSWEAIQGGIRSIL